MYRPNRMMPNAIIMAAASSEILAAPPNPCCRTAAAMTGTVALAVPLTSTGFRPRMAVNGAVKIDGNTSRTGGTPTSCAIGQAIRHRNQGGDDATEAIARKQTHAIIAA